MAADYGDDIGDMILRAAGRAFGRAAESYLRERMYGYYQDAAKRQGLNEQEANAQAEIMAEREQVCLPFGDETEASIFAQVCRENGTFAAALVDEHGGGYIQFAREDIEAVRACVPQFSETMTARINRDIAERLAESRAVDPELYSTLKVVMDQPDRAQATKDVPDRAAQTVQNHTEHIADEVAAAKQSAKGYDDFERILAEKHIGITTTTAGELMYYEARVDDKGDLLPFGKDADGKRDWAVGADTLKNKYGVDATQDAFGRTKAQSERPGQPGRESRITDGALDTDGRTPDLDQGIESHDGMDTDTRTLRLEREQNGTDIPPSKVREATERSQVSERDYNLASVARESREASHALEKSRGMDEPTLGPSDRLNPVR